MNLASESPLGYFLPKLADTRNIISLVILEFLSCLVFLAILRTAGVPMNLVQYSCFRGLPESAVCNVVVI